MRLFPSASPTAGELRAWYMTAPFSFAAKVKAKAKGMMTASGAGRSGAAAGVGRSGGVGATGRSPEGR